MARSASPNPIGGGASPSQTAPQFGLLGSGSRPGPIGGDESASEYETAPDYEAAPEDETAAAERFLNSHDFHATKSAGPGDVEFLVWLDNQPVRQVDVQDALAQAIPGLQYDPIRLSVFVADRFDQEIGAASVLARAEAAQLASGVDPASQDLPDGVLQRTADGKVFWQPNPAVQTIGGPPLLQAPANWIEGLLSFYGLGAPTGGSGECSFNGQPASLSSVVVTVIQQAQLNGYSEEFTVVLGIVQRIVDAAIKEQIAKAVEDDDDGPVTFSVLLVLLQGHDGLKNIGNSQDPSFSQVQVTGQYRIRVHHLSKNWKLEGDLVGQMSFAYDQVNHKLLPQVLGGGQVSATDEIVKKLFAVQAFVQVLEGVTYTEGMTKSGTVQTKAVATQQTALGVQINLSIGGLTFFVQLQGSTTGNTDTHKATLTLDGSVGAGLQFSF